MTVPDLKSIEKKPSDLSSIQELDINDLIDRKPVLFEHDLPKKFISSKIVVVTGGGGSIGSQLSRQIIEYQPKKLIIIESSEYALYKITNSLNKLNYNQNTEIIPLLENVCNEKEIDNIFKIYKPEIVYHSAAYKHVPIVEENIISGIKNNIFGTKIIIDTALKYNVNNFILISTDKAVRPTNIMGATKRFAEIYTQAKSEIANHTKLSIVRFGNVIGSSGSVIPKFTKQILSGGPVSVTHKEITRYFMTIPEASFLVIYASLLSEGGEVFLLDMGKPVKIYDLAKKMILSHGFTIKNSSNKNGNIEIKITGLRPGEKLYEELLIGEDSTNTNHSMIKKAQEEFIEMSEIVGQINNLENYIKSYQIEKIYKFFNKNIEGFQQDLVVDKLYLEES